MKQLINILERYGVWILLAGSFSIFLSSGAPNHSLNLLFLFFGAAAMLLEPAVFIVGSKKLNRPLEKSHIAVWILFALALLLYYVRGFLDIPLDKVTAGSDPFIERLRYLLLFLFVIIYVSALIYRFFLGLAFASNQAMTISLYKLKRQRMNSAVFSTVSAFIFLLFVNYVTHLRNPVWDFTPGYYSFSSSAKTIIKSLESDITVYAFLPIQQAVQKRDDGYRNPELFRIAEDVRNIMEQLPLINPRITVKFLNADIETPELIDFGSVVNGSIIFRVSKKVITSLNEKPYIERRIHIRSENDLENLEQEMVRALIHVSTPSKKIYFTASNGERHTYTDRAREPEGIKQFEEELRFYNFELSQLDSNSSWPGSIPEDADVLFISGPSVPFTKEAKEAINAYIKSGGSVFVAISPTGKEDFSWLLKNAGSHGYAFNPKILSSQFPGIIVTNTLEKHSINENLRLTGNHFLVIPMAGYFEERGKQEAKEVPVKNKDPKNAPADSDQNPLFAYRASVVLNSPYNTIEDVNLNGKLDKGEKSGKYPLMLAFEKVEKDSEKIIYPLRNNSRLIFSSGVDWLTDRTMQYLVMKRDHKNLLLAVDSLLWLTETPLVAAIQPKNIKFRSVQVTDSMKFKNILMGMVLFPLLTILLAVGGVYIYRTRHRNFGNK